MEWSDIKVRKSDAAQRIEAKLTGGHMINGDNGCYVTFCGWGPDEASARENLKIAIAQARDENPEG